MGTLFVGRLPVKIEKNLLGYPESLIHFFTNEYPAADEVEVSFNATKW